MDTHDEGTTHLSVEGFVRLDWDDVSLEQIEDAPIYDRRDQKVNDVDDVVLDDSGRPATVVFDAGGFLGIGAHRVGIDVDRFSVQQRVDGDEVRLYLDMAEDELRGQPLFAGILAPAATRQPGTT